MTIILIGRKHGICPVCNRETVVYEYEVIENEKRKRKEKACLPCIYKKYRDIILLGMVG